MTCPVGYIAVYTGGGDVTSNRFDSGWREVAFTSQVQQSLLQIASQVWATPLPSAWTGLAS